PTLRTDGRCSRACAGAAGADEVHGGHSPNVGPRLDLKKGAARAAKPNCGPRWPRCLLAAPILRDFTCLVANCPRPAQAPSIGCTASGARRARFALLLFRKAHRRREGGFA